MHLVRPAFASDPRTFGQRAAALLDSAPVGPASAPATRLGEWIPADLKLFATTFVAGFLFVSVLIY